MLKRMVVVLVFVFEIVSGQTSYRDLSIENWVFNQQNKPEKYIATVPGTVHTDLFKNKLISDPFFGSNEKELQWIEHENWEYETSFVLSESEFKNKYIDLEFEGLDTYASIYLNGKMILKTDNMFRKWSIPSKLYLKEGTNQLKVIFQSATQIGKEAASKLTYTLPEKERVFVRKAQYQFGWDWGPRFVTAGIWKKVQLKFWNFLQVENIHYQTLTLNKEKAILSFSLQIYAVQNENIQIQINKDFKKVTLTKGLNIVKIPYEINNPVLWWCNGLGEPYLYDFTVKILHKQEPVATKNLKIGLKTLELVTEKDEFGTQLFFKLNGKPVFMKGANIVPPDSFLPKVSDSIYYNLVVNAKKANMNMLRVWGGGVYPEEVFYDACDANGILVWQDFMFACAMYPGDAKFIENVKQEVIQQINRLQNHTSLALWCGNNEIAEGWQNWGWQKQFNYTKTDSLQIWQDYEKVFHQIMPNALDSLLPKERNNYWASSPSLGWGQKESLTQGDVHYWGVWWGKEPFEIYEKKVGRFVSEYGFQGMPNLSTLQKVLEQQDLNFNSGAYKNHQKHPTGSETIHEYLARDFDTPVHFEDYIYVSQLLQARGMKTAIEAHRRAKPYCMGTLYWQLNDCWPVTSWSSIDYYGNWKAFHYQAKRSFENKLLSVYQNTKHYEVHFVNHTFETLAHELTLKLLTFDGKILWQTTKKTTIPENSSSVVHEIPIQDFKGFDLKNAVLVVTFDDVKTNYFFKKPKELDLQKPKITISKINPFTVEITTDVLAKDVFLSSNQETHFEDNYFDLLPNEKKIIKLSKSVKEIKFKSLVDIEGD